MSFKIGDWAEWTSRGRGGATTKRGRCVYIVKRGGSAKERTYDLLWNHNDKYILPNIELWGSGRDHESYIFAVKNGNKGKSLLYWPRVKNLKKIDKPEGDGS